MSRVLDFSDGFTSSTEPTTGTITSNNLRQFADDAAFVTYKAEAASDGDIYFNTTSNKARLYNGTDWVEVVSQDASGNLIVSGNLTVQGTTTTLNTQTLDVEDLNITVNKGGDDTTAQGSGLTVERTGANGSLVYDSALASKWKAGSLGSEAEIVTVADTQTLTNKTLTSPVINSPTGIVKADVGLSNVDNTTDLNKPISTATQTALNLKADSTQVATDIATAVSTHDADTSSHGVSGAIVGTTDTQALTNKDIDGGTASNTSRITLPKAAKTTLDALTRKEGTILFDTTSGKPYYDDGTNLKVIGSGSGGGTNFITNGDAETGTTGWTAYNDSASSEAVTLGGGGIVNKTAHGLNVGDRVYFSAIVTSTGISTNTIYYVYSTLANAFLISATKGGSAITFTAGSATMHRVIPFDGTGGTANITFTTTSTNPLSENNSFLISKDAANRIGEGVSYDFTIGLASKAKVLKIEFDYIVNSGTFVAGSSAGDSDIIVYIYDKDNSQLIEPSSFKFLSNSTTISDKFSATFQTSATGTQYRLIFHVASTSTAAYALKFDNVSVSPSQYVYGTPITDLAPYTASLSYGGTAATNISSQTYRFAQTGDRLSIEGTIFFNGPANTNGVFRIPLPPGLTIDTSKTSGNYQKLNGTVSFFRTSGSAFYGLGLPVLDGATNGGANNYFLVNSVNYSGLGVQQWQGSTTGASNVPTGAALASGDALEFSISDIPILGWSSSVQVADGYEGRVVAADMQNSSFSAAQNSGTFSQITGLTKVLDNTDLISGNSYVIKSSGLYNLGINIGTGPNAGTKAARIRVNGTDAVPVVQGTASSYCSLFGSGVRDLKAGDVVTIYYTNYAAAETWFIGSFSIEKLSGSPTISATETVSALYTGAPPTGTLGAAWNTVTFGTKVKDSHGAYASGTYTIPVSGQYDISAQVNIIMNTVASNIAGCALSINGVVTYQHQIRTEATITGAALFPAFNIKSVPLKAGDTVRVVSYANGTSPIYEATGTANFFSITRSGGY